MSSASLLDLKMTMSWTHLSVRSLDNKPTVTALQAVGHYYNILCGSVWHCQQS